MIIVFVICFCSFLRDPTLQDTTLLVRVLQRHIARRTFFVLVSCCVPSGSFTVTVPGTFRVCGVILSAPPSMVFARCVLCCFRWLCLSVRNCVRQSGRLFVLITRYERPMHSNSSRWTRERETRDHLVEQHRATCCRCCCHAEWDQGDES